MPNEKPLLTQGDVTVQQGEIPTLYYDSTSKCAAQAANFLRCGTPRVRVLIDATPTASCNDRLQHLAELLYMLRNQGEDVLELRDGPSQGTTLVAWVHLKKFR